MQIAMEFSSAAEASASNGPAKIEKRERFAPLCVQSEYTGDLFFGLAVAVRLARS
jgi:hypothetical protein